MKQMLEAVVKAAIDGGFALTSLRLLEESNYNLDSWSIGEFSRLSIIYKHKIEYFFEREYTSLPDLILNRSFMEAVYWDGQGECLARKFIYDHKIELGFFESDECFLDRSCLNHCDCWSDTYLVHVVEATRISLTTGIEPAIKYLFDNLPKEGE